MLLSCWIPLGHELLGDEFAAKNIDVRVEDSSMIIDLRTLHALQSVDVDLRSELYSFVWSFFRAAVSFKDYSAASKVIVPIDKESTMLVWDVEFCLLQLIFKPLNETWLHDRDFETFPELFSIDHASFQLLLSIIISCARI